MKLLNCVAASLVLCCGGSGADEPEGDCRELLKPAAPVPEAENGAALMASMVKQCDAGEIRSYDFGFRAPEFLVNKESLEAFFKEQPKLVEITRRILARKRFQNGSTKAPDGIPLLTKACDAIRLQALVLAQEGRVEKAVPDLLLVTAFSRKLVQSPESTTLLMMGIGMAGKDATCLAQVLRQARNTAGMRPLAIGYEPLTRSDMDCAGAIRGELRNYCDHFDIIRAGGEPLQKLLAELHLVSEMNAAFKKAFQKTKQDDPDPGKGIADTVASREERIAALVKNPSASMKAQLREVAKIDWKKHDQDFARYVRVVLATDSST
ncbi:MAG TPA: hypothetical protein VG796_08485 [Verrucomicrobiales bacterium]|nr:hypothetical protein [Verrucomicrobiales bacterium]